jgi:hypothetical protein
MKSEIYLRLRIWNYDASPRVQFYEERIESVLYARRMVQRIRNMFGALPSQLCVGRNWLSRRGIDGHILEVIGVYRRTEEKLI